MTISELRLLCKDETINMSHHVYVRCVQRNISYSEIKQTIMQGDIIEQYTDDKYYPSALVLAINISGRPIHVVASIGDGMLHIITVYVPNLDEWENDYKTRKAVLS